MIIEELTVHDFGVFAGRHTLHLAPSPRRPIVLVGGLNGSGKTTLLEALGLALFGKHAAIGSRRGGSYDDYLGRAIHRRADPANGAAVAVTFTARQDGVDHRVEVRRSWTRRGARVRERLDVVRDGARDPVLSDQWDEHVETFVPRGVAPLFFFDGEQLEAFADLENSQELLRTAVGALLGLDLVDRLVDDLVVLERRKRMETSTAATRAEVDRLQAEIGRLRREEHRRVEETTAAEARVARCQRRVRELDDRFRSEGGELFEAADALSARRAEVSAQAAALRARLREVAAGAAPLLLVAEAVARLADAVPDVARTPEFAAAVRERDRRLLAHLERSGLGDGAAAAVAQFLAADGDGAASDAAAPAATVIEEARRLRQNALPESAELIRGTSSDLGCALDELDALDRKLAAVPAPDAIAGLLAERVAVMSEFDEAQTVLAEAQESLADVRRDIVRRETEADRVLESAAQELLAEEDSQRVIDASRRARETAAKFRSAATARHVGRIERLVLDSLELLLRKDRLVADMRIDPEDFRVTLYGSGGTVIQPHDLSAGERQLLATSMLWGLARASARPLPVVIDTPLGRLDSAHRAHLIDRYFPHASHQVVLLSTDEEIDEAAWDRLRPKTARAFHLAFDDDADGTVVRAGYLFEDADAS